MGIAKTILYPLWILTVIFGAVLLISIIRLSLDPIMDIIIWRNISLVAFLICLVTSITLSKLINSVNDELSWYRLELLAVKKRLEER